LPDTCALHIHAVANTQVPCLCVNKCCRVVLCLSQLTAHTVTGTVPPSLPAANHGTLDAGGRDVGTVSGQIQTDPRRLARRPSRVAAGRGPRRATTGRPRPSALNELALASRLAGPRSGVHHAAWPVIMTTADATLQRTLIMQEQMLGPNHDDVSVTLTY
jgi:hypothetical protein